MVVIICTARVLSPPYLLLPLYRCLEWAFARKFLPRLKFVGCFQNNGGEENGSLNLFSEYASVDKYQIPDQERDNHIKGKHRRGRRATCELITGSTTYS